jgi:hypothetical protein
MMQRYRFVGGKYDGDLLPVAEPVRPGLELRVRSLEATGCSEFYVLEDDGCFHAQSPSAGDTCLPASVRDASHPLPSASIAG